MDHGERPRRKRTESRNSGIRMSKEDMQATPGIHGIFENGAAHDFARKGPASTGLESLKGLYPLTGEFALAGQEFQDRLSEARALVPLSTEFKHNRISPEGPEREALLREFPWIDHRAAIQMVFGAEFAAVIKRYPIWSYDGTYVSPDQIKRWTTGEALPNDREQLEEVLNDAGVPLEEQRELLEAYDLARKVPRVLGERVQKAAVDCLALTQLVWTSDAEIQMRRGAIAAKNAAVATALPQQALALRVELERENEQLQQIVAQHEVDVHRLLEVSGAMSRLVTEFFAAVDAGA
jgi:DNA-binding transcriptional MerR regulator